MADQISEIMDRRMIADVGKVVGEGSALSRGDEMGRCYGGHSVWRCDSGLINRDNHCHHEVGVVGSCLALFV